MSIRLSTKHGVNASIGVCFYCNEENGEVILPGHLPGDAEAPRKAIWHKHPCDKCEAHMKLGIILISVRTNESETDNPYRTGGWVVVSEDFIRRLVQEPLLSRLLAKRVSFMPDNIWDAIGLPRGVEIDNRPKEQS